ncbi:2-keto-3-deoxy-galactonokinase [Pluralibacter gergoviae]|nr:2-keto-3-deoxy-galactonokinase [Pluralibacter gergoviae]
MPLTGDRATCGPGTLPTGACVNRLSLPYGVTRIAPGEAPEIFRRHIAPWCGASPLPVVMAGMIGSDAGWRPVPYLACPLPLAGIGRGLYEVEEQVWIVPGLKLEREGEYGVMRGEETQLLGAMRLAPAACCVMPGTHSKWVGLSGGSVERFDTAMTGELHHLLMHHSLIGKGLPAQRRDDRAFTRGLEKGAWRTVAGECAVRDPRRKSAGRAGGDRRGRCAFRSADRRRGSDVQPPLPGGTDNAGGKRRARAPLPPGVRPPGHRRQPLSWRGGIFTGHKEHY